MLVARRLILPRPAARTLALRRLHSDTHSSWNLNHLFRPRQHEASSETCGAEFLDTVERHVRLGASVRGAIQSAATEQGPALDEILRVLLLHCSTGAPLDDSAVLDDAARRATDDAFLIRSLVAAGAGGQASAFCLQRAAWALRERQAIRAERRTYAAQAVFSARVLSWLPVLFGVVMMTTNESVRSAYFGGFIGLMCVTVGVALNITGRRWMRRITCSFA